jgi:hypothetical protein
MASPKWTILDMWENSLHCPSPELVRILCVGVSPSILLPAPTCQGKLLGAPVYESWEAQRKQHDLQISNLKDDE